MTEQHETPQLRVAVDLTREEYVAFATQAHATPVLRRQRMTLSIISTLIVVGMCVFFLISDWQTQGLVDPYVVILLLISLGVGLFSTVGLPILARRKAAKEYDRSVQFGMEYYGEVRLYDDRIEKETADRVTAIPLNGTTVFTEQQEVLSFAVPGKPALVLFARYLNADQAARLREAALSKLPPHNCRLLSRFTATGTGDLPLPDLTKEPEEPMVLSFRYTPDEMEDIFRTGAAATFAKRTPGLLILVLFIALLIAMIAENLLVGAGSLVVVSLLTAWLFWWRPLRQGVAVIRRNESGFKAEIAITSKNVTVSMDKAMSQMAPWKAITRAVNNPETIVLYVEKTPLIIPKRALEDEAAFCDMVDTYMGVTPRGES